MERFDHYYAEHECAKLLANFYRALDSRHYDDLIETFTREGVWNRGGEVSKAKDLRPLLELRYPNETIIHVLSNICFITTEDKRVETESLLTVYLGTRSYDSEPSEGSAHAVVLAKTQYSFEAGVWLISYHDFTPLMML